MSNLVERYNAIKERKQELETRKIQLQTKMEGYKESYKEGIEELKEKYGVDTLKDAKVKLTNLKSECEEIVKDLDEKMKPFESTDDFEIEGV